MTPNRRRLVRSAQPEQNRRSVSQPLPESEPPGTRAARYIAAAEHGEAWLTLEAGDGIVPVTR